MPTHWVYSWVTIRICWILSLPSAAGSLEYTNGSSNPSFDVDDFLSNDHLSWLAENCDFSVLQDLVSDLYSDSDITEVEYKAYFLTVLNNAPISD